MMSVVFVKPHAVVCISLILGKLDKTGFNFESEKLVKCRYIIPDQGLFGNVPVQPPHLGFFS